jgi:hypothetical protein
MKRLTGSPLLCLASSVTEKTLMANSDQRMHSVLAALEECQAVLVTNANRDTAQLVSVAILDLRMKLNRIADSELKALCDSMVREEEARASQNHPKSRRGPAVKLVK